MSSYLKWLSCCNINKFLPKLIMIVGSIPVPISKSENQWLIVNPGKIKKGTGWDDKSWPVIL